MYAYVGRTGQYNEYYEQDGDWDPDTQAWKANGSVTKPRELAYWRKHPNLHGWMKKLWEAKGNSGDFNGNELELTWEELDMLEEDIRDGNLPNTGGFFFGDNADEYYKEADLKFIREAKAELIVGLQVFYNSSW